MITCSNRFLIKIGFMSFFVFNDNVSILKCYSFHNKVLFFKMLTITLCSNCGYDSSSFNSISNSFISSILNLAIFSFSLRILNFDSIFASSFFLFISIIFSSFNQFLIVSFIFILLILFALCSGVSHFNFYFICFVLRWF